MPRYCLIMLSFFFTGFSQASAQQYYAPFHKPDTSNSGISKIGQYISVGMGVGYPGSSIGRGVAKTISFSLAWQSHVLSFSASNISPSLNGQGTKNFNYNNSNLHLAYGESFRAKDLFISLSTGVAFSSIKTDIPPKDFYNYQGLAIPVELKLFRLTAKGLGLGIHLSKYFTPSTRHSPALVTLSIMFGQWNRAK